jgi:hypothetical protein
VLGRAIAQDEEGCGCACGAADMEAWMALAEPGAEHAEMKKMVGSWSCDVKMWMDPAGEPQMSKGKAVFSMALGDRFLKQDYQGDFMGMPFTGIGYTGFNNATKKWESMWLDSGGTGIMMSTGTETEKGKAYSYTGSFYGPGGALVKSRMVMKKISDDKQVMEMYNDLGDGRGECKCMEITYNRAK